MYRETTVFSEIECYFLKMDHSAIRAHKVVAAASLKTCMYAKEKLVLTFMWPLQLPTSFSSGKSIENSSLLGKNEEEATTKKEKYSCMYVPTIHVLALESPIIQCWRCAKNGSNFS